MKIEPEHSELLQRIDARLTVIEQEETAANQFERAKLSQERSELERQAKDILSDDGA
jgi:hypothetical protein